MSDTQAETLALIDGLLKEHRTFPPPEEFRRSAVIGDDSVYREAEADFEIARPAAVLFGDDLPKTRSGEIMRRLLKNIAEGQALGDTTTLRDPAIVEDLKRKADRALGRAT